MSEYVTTKGHRYSFSGWQPGESPLECFDARNWLSCLHGVLLCYHLIGDAAATQRAVEDDGLIHELLHLASAIDISTHLTLEDLRAELVALGSDFMIALQRVNN